MPIIAASAVIVSWPAPCAEGSGCVWTIEAKADAGACDMGDLLIECIVTTPNTSATIMSTPQSPRRRTATGSILRPGDLIAPILGDPSHTPARRSCRYRQTARLVDRLS